MSGDVVLVSLAAIASIAAWAFVSRRRSPDTERAAAAAPPPGFFRRYRPGDDDSPKRAPARDT